MGTLWTQTSRFLHLKQDLSWFDFLPISGRVDEFPLTSTSAPAHSLAADFAANHRRSLIGEPVR